MEQVTRRSWDFVFINDCIVESRVREITASDGVCVCVEFDRFA